MHDSIRIPLDAGHADVDQLDGAVELTVRLGGRIALGAAFTPAEAARIGAALTAAADAAWAVEAAQVDMSGVETVADLLHASQGSGVPARMLFGRVDR